MALYRDYVIGMHRLNRYGMVKKNRRANKGTLAANIAILPSPTLPGLHPVGIERSHHYTLLRTPLIMPWDRWSTTPFLRTRSWWSELPRSCAAVAKKRSQRKRKKKRRRRREKSPLERNCGIPGPRREVARSLFKPHYNTSEEWRECERSRRRSLLSNSPRLVSLHRTIGYTSRFTPLPSPSFSIGRGLEGGCCRR